MSGQKGDFPPPDLCPTAAAEKEDRLLALCTWRDAGLSRMSSEGTSRKRDMIGHMQMGSWDGDGSLG